MNTICDWINGLLFMIEPSDNVFKMISLNKCVTVKKYDDIYHHYGNNCKLTIIGCEESNIYIDSNVETLLINTCINCTIFVAAVSKVCTVEKCENVTICVASSQLRIGNCVDSMIYSFTSSFPPIVYGDTRNLRMAPHNASYPYMPEHLKRANIPFDSVFMQETGGSKDSSLSDSFKQAINNFRNPVQIAKGERTGNLQSNDFFSILPLVDFNKMTLPQSMQDFG